MSNELLLLVSVLIYFGALLIFYKVFGKNGIIVWTAISLIFANIEVQLFVKAYAMEMTLGNVCFASSFLVTDILSEKYGKNEASKAVFIGIATGLIFIIVTRFWLAFDVLNNDMFSAFKTVFKSTTRVVLSGFIVYAIVQFIDVNIYHYIWKRTTDKSGDKEKFLWLRNNGSTVISQLLNAILFNVCAFYGVVNFKMLISFIISTFIISAIIALIDTPFLYLAKKITPLKIFQ